MIEVEQTGSEIRICTDALQATVRLEGYVSGVAGGTLIDRHTGAHDLGHGLDVVDFLLEPGWASEADEAALGARYSRDPAAHGHLPKHYVELPQICTGARRLDAQVIDGRAAAAPFVAVRQWYRYQRAAPGRQAGSLWEQTLVFTAGRRYFLAADRIVSQNDSDALVLRIDLPGHIKHRDGPTFRQVYLSYATGPAPVAQGEHVGQPSGPLLLPSSAFDEPFPPDARYLYQRGRQPLPERFIRAYQVLLPAGSAAPARPGPWLAGMTLAPEVVYEAWCHEKAAGRYVCLIEEIGGRSVRRGERFGAAYVVGYFDSLDEMHHTYDRHRGAAAIEVERTGYRLASA
jgi:hypothetical protein